MVKLFVGGLPEGVDSIRLRQLFSQFVIVNECDVIKDYAFVHVADEEAERIAIEKLDGYILEGKSINIRRSTSQLRKEPGMDKRCFRCGASVHKTPQCPNNPSNIALKRVNSGSTSLTTLAGAPDAKRFVSESLTTATSVSSYTPTIKIDLTGRNQETTVAQPQPQPQPQTIAPSYVYSQPQPQSVVQPQTAPAPVLSLSELDPELPRPVDSDLLPLYEQYIDSRSKYFYFRERLSKEVKVRSQLAPVAAVAAPLQAPYATAMYSTPPPQQQQQQYTQQGAPTSTGYASSPHFYSNAVSTSIYSATQPHRLY